MLLSRLAVFPSPSWLYAIAATSLLAVTAAAQVVEVALAAAPATLQVAPGVAVNAWTYNGSLPGPTLRVTQGQTLRVRFSNRLPEATAIHWHGQPIQLGMDGVPDISRPAIAAGQEFIYELRDLHPGTYWFHPHGHEMQLDQGLYGALIVDPALPTQDPPADVEQTIILDDWTNPLGGAFSGHLLNGRSSAGQSPIAVQAGQRLRLRVINAAATTHYVFALDGHSMTVTHADGNRVQPVVTQAIPIGIGERWDVIVDCNNPGTWSLAVAAIGNRASTVVRGVVQYAGHNGALPSPTLVPTNLATGSLLNYSQLAAYFPVQPITSTPNRTFTAALAMGMGPNGMEHTINGQAWPNVTPMQVMQGDQVQLTFQNTGMAMMSEHHPMHIHGHFFRLLNTAGGTLHPPLKDTVLISPVGQLGSSRTVQLAMDNPGRWLLHCHNMEHMATGMMTAVEYLGDADGDAVPSRSDYEPMQPLPVVTISAIASRFAPGASGTIDVQWTPAALVALYLGLGELSPWQVVPGLGTLVIDPATAALHGISTTSPQGSAAFAYSLPNAPALLGVRIGCQGLGVPVSALPLLSTYQAFTIR